MANYSLVANTQFKARNFEDLLKPYAMYTQEYRSQEDALAELATKADVWQGLANEQTDPVAYAQYTNYANALKDQAAVMADRGLDPSSRQAMLNLKRRYASEIVPIEQAYANRKTQAEEQRKALLQNPTLMMSRRADSTSLDRYLENPNLGYESYSGALLTQQAGQAAAAIAKELRSYGKGKPLDGFTRTWLQQHGYSAGEVAFAINHPDDPRASSVLNSIVNNVMADSGMSEWADNKTLNQAYNYARQGLWQAVGQTQVGTYTDEAAKLRAQEEMQKRAEARAAKAAREAAGLVPGQAGIGNVSLRGNPKNIYTKQELEAAEKMAKQYSQYFYKDKDGKYKMNQAGWNEYRRMTDNTRAVSDGYGHYTYQKTGTQSHSAFYNYMNSLNGGKAVTNQTTYGPWARERFGELYNRSAHMETSAYDAKRSTVYAYDFGNQENTVIQQLKRNTDGKGKIDTYDWNGNAFTKSPSKLDLMKEADNIIGVEGEYSQYGTFMKIKMKDGTQYRVSTDIINPTASQNVRDRVTGALDFNYTDDNADTPIDIGLGYPTTRRNVRNARLNQAHDAFGTIVGVNQTEPMRVEQGFY